MNERRRSSKPAVILLVQPDLLSGRSYRPAGKNARCCQKSAGLATAATSKVVQCVTRPGLFLVPPREDLPRPTSRLPNRLFFDSSRRFRRQMTNRANGPQTRGFRKQRRTRECGVVPQRFQLDVRKRLVPPAFRARLLSERQFGAATGGAALHGTATLEAARQLHRLSQCGSLGRRAAPHGRSTGEHLAEGPQPS